MSYLLPLLIKVLLIILILCIGSCGCHFTGCERHPLVCVWVVDEHDEDILVVVSKYRPNRMLTNGDVTMSTTGASIDFSCAASSLSYMFKFLVR